MGLKQIPEALQMLQVAAEKRHLQHRRIEVSHVSRILSF